MIAQIQAALSIIQAARRRVQVVDYALGVAALGASGAIVIALLGHTLTSAIVVGLVFIGSILIFLFSRLVKSQSVSVSSAGIVLMWAVLFFFILFLIFTATAVAFQWPDPWARALRLSIVSTSPDRFADCRASLTGWSEDQEASTLSSYSTEKHVEPGVFCKITLQDHPTDPEANELYAEALVETGNLEAAIAQFIKASDLGSVRASIVLGIYFSLWKEKSAPLSIEYFERAVHAGDRDAAVSLGRLFEVGTFAAPDYKRAAALYQTAADRGSPEGYFRLGQLTQFGLGIPQDASQARILLRKAANLGYQPAVGALNDLANR